MSAPRVLSIQFIVETGKWRSKKTALLLMRRAARGAWKKASRARRAEVTILLADDARLKALNADFRGQNKPTNVLSFPSSTRDSLGDIALSYGVIAREAKEQGKDFASHAAHLAAHGVLHLLGHDHEIGAEAEAMEALERRVLAEMGLPDPYSLARPKAKTVKKHPKPPRKRVYARRAEAE